MLIRETRLTRFGHCRHVGFVLLLSMVGLPMLDNSGASFGQDIRIESHVKMGQSLRPVSENLTIFSEGAVYDFRFDVGEPRVLKEIVVFYVREMGQGEFVLIDPERMLRLDIDARMLTELVNQLQSNQVINERAPHLLYPDFDEHWDDTTGVLTLNSDRINYVARGLRTASAPALDLYHDFANWYAKLRAADPRKIPPFARLELNEAMHRRGFIPEQVEFSLLPDGGIVNTPMRATSEHFIVWTLSQTDKEYIRQARELISQARPIGIDGYFQLQELSQ